MGVIISLIIGIVIGLKLYKWKCAVMAPIEDLGYLLKDWKKKWQGGEKNM